MKKSFFSVAILATLLFAACKNNDPLIDKGVVINGVTWATRNVGSTVGTFVDKPENYGGYYKWQEAKTACPSGWRLPTGDELGTLLDTDKVSNKWTTLNGINGYRFKDIATGKNIFLPAGSRCSSDGVLFETEIGIDGCYWSSSPLGDFAGHLYFFSEKLGLYAESRATGSSVRCVKSKFNP